MAVGVLTDDIWKIYWHLKYFRLRETAVIMRPYNPSVEFWDTHGEELCRPMAFESVWLCHRPNRLPKPLLAYVEVVVGHVRRVIPKFSSYFFLGTISKISSSKDKCQNMHWLLKGYSQPSTLWKNYKPRKEVRDELGTSNAQLKMRGILH